MELKEVIGVLLAVLAVAVAGGGIWAARYYSHPRVYGRQLTAERRARRHD